MPLFFRPHRAPPPPRGHAPLRTGQERESAAVHEAGHVLYFALAPHDPRLRADVIYRVSGAGVSGGQVRYSPPRLPLTRLHLRWEMEQLLAGEEAERLLLGQSLGVASSDLERHEALAGVFLAGRGGAADLERLREDQRRSVRRFLRDHPGTLRLIADQLLIHGALGARDLYPLLSGVRPIASAPLLRGAWCRS